MTAVEREFVSLDSVTGRRNGAGLRTCQELHYKPAKSLHLVASLATRYNSDFSEHYIAQRMAARDLWFLCWNTRFRVKKPFFLLERASIDIGAGVYWLKRKAGVDVVVLMGNSVGGSLMAVYQSQAISVTMQGAPGPMIPRVLKELLAADFYVSLCAHGGCPEVLTAWFHPAVADESEPFSVVAELDMYNPEHGSPDSPDFIARYRSERVDRNNRITLWCHEELARIERLGNCAPAFNVYRTWADPRLMEVS